MVPLVGDRSAQGLAAIIGDQIQADETLATTSADGPGSRRSERAIPAPLRVDLVFHLIVVSVCVKAERVATRVNDLALEQRERIFGTDGYPDDGLIVTRAKHPVTGRPPGLGF